MTSMTFELLLLILNISTAPNSCIIGTNSELTNQMFSQNKVDSKVRSDSDPCQDPWVSQVDTHMTTTWMALRNGMTSYRRVVRGLRTVGLLVEQECFWLSMCLCRRSKLSEQTS